MQQVLKVIDWFLNAPNEYRANEPTRRDELLAIVQREIASCSTEVEKAPWESRRTRLEQS